MLCPAYPMSMKAQLVFGLFTTNRSVFFHHHVQLSLGNGIITLVQNSFLTLRLAWSACSV